MIQLTINEVTKVSLFYNHIIVAYSLLVNMVSRKLTIFLWRKSMGIYERIQTKATEKGISIKKLEQEVGIGNGVIKRWNTSSPQCNKLLLVANYLQISIEWLITGKITNELTENEKELLKNFKTLPEREQIKFIGKIEDIAEKYKNQTEKLSNLEKIEQAK